MSEKSYVSMGVHACPVCLTQFETNEILLDRRLRNSMERYTLSGFSLCQSCQEKKDSGFIALVEVNKEPDKGDHPGLWDRSGKFAHIKQEAWDKVFNVPCPDKGIALLELGSIDKLAKMTYAKTI